MGGKRKGGKKDGRKEEDRKNKEEDMESLETAEDMESKMQRRPKKDDDDDEEGDKKMDMFKDLDEDEKEELMDRLEGMIRKLKAGGFDNSEESSEESAEESAEDFDGTTEQPGDSAESTQEPKGMEMSPEAKADLEDAEELGQELEETLRRLQNDL